MGGDLEMAAAVLVTFRTPTTPPGTNMSCSYVLVSYGEPLEETPQILESEQVQIIRWGILAAYDRLRPIIGNAWAGRSPASRAIPSLFPASWVLRS